MLFETKLKYVDEGKTLGQILKQQKSKKLILRKEKILTSEKQSEFPKENRKHVSVKQAIITVA